MRRALRLAALFATAIVAGMLTVPAQCPQGGCPPPKNPYAVQLTWASSSGATGYLVFRVPVTGTGALVQLTASPVTSAAYKDTTTTPGQFYLYSVEAVNAAGQSGPSNVWMGGTPVSNAQNPQPGPQAPPKKKRKHR